MPPAPVRSRSASSEAPHALFPARLARLGKTVSDLGLAALLITSPKDVGYLTGFLGGDSYLLLPALEHKAPSPVLISDFRYKEELEPVVADFAKAGAKLEVHIRSKSMLEAVAEVCPAALGESGKLGIQADHMTVAERAGVARRVGSKRLTDTHGLVAQMRVIKDASEIALIRKAAKIQEAALAAVLPTIRAGQTEAEVAARLEAEMKQRGSSEPGFQTIVAAGPNSALPHYRPKQTKVAAKKPLLVDWGAVYEGYHSDMTRVFCLGEWPAKIAEIYAIVLEAQQAAAKALAPGKTTKEIDAVARTIITKAGFGEFFGHGLGHGLGLNGHEEPRLTNMLASTRLEPGMVVTVEPGIYLPGVGGVRLEDDYVITDDGADNLCSMKKSLDWATL